MIDLRKKTDKKTASLFDAVFVQGNANSQQLLTAFIRLFVPVAILLIALAK